MNACATSNVTEIASISDTLDLYRGKRILITGGRGFIGAALSQALASGDITNQAIDAGDFEAGRAGKVD